MPHYLFPLKSIQLEYTNFLIKNNKPVVWVLNISHLRVDVYVIAFLHKYSVAKCYWPTPNYCDMNDLRIGTMYSILLLDCVYVIGNSMAIDYFWTTL